jgi:hypothetical protein
MYFDEPLTTGNFSYSFFIVLTPGAANTATAAQIFGQERWASTSQFSFRNGRTDNMENSANINAAHSTPISMGTTKKSSLYENAWILQATWMSL